MGYTRCDSNKLFLASSDARGENDSLGSILACENVTSAEQNSCNMFHFKVARTKHRAGHKNIGMVQSRRDSNVSQFRSLSGQGSFQTDRSDDLRSVEPSGSRPTRLGSLLVNWSALFNKTRRAQQQNALVISFQKRPALNADSVVALLEFVIIAISLVQLELTFRSPFWRENRACREARHLDCAMLPESSFIVANGLRVFIAALSICRISLRFKYLWNRKPEWYLETPATKLRKCCPYMLEIMYTVIFPYPGLETFSSVVLFMLSISVAFRTICWQHLLYFPYPIREKGKVTSFSGNLEFTYPEFVLKKVLDDDPLKKIGLVFVILLLLCSYLLHVLETLNGACVWIAATASETTGHFNCAELSLPDSLWFTVMSFLKVGYGDIVPRTEGGRVFVGCTSCLMIALSSMFFSIVIKKFQFSSMEARVHSFLFRRNLYAQKDLSAVMAVQATFRFNKSYRGSLVWHKQDGSDEVYFRPLSARLPNEVKKKLYISRFQIRLKEILKFNTDGDPINAFSKHVEVITAALGVTLVEMTMLKKIYFRKTRLQRERHRKMLHAASVKLTRSDLAGVVSMAVIDTRASRLNSCTALKSYASSLSDNEPAAVAAESVVPTQPDIDLNQASCGVVVVVEGSWQQRMQQRAEETMRLLRKIELDAKDIVDMYDFCE